MNISSGNVTQAAATEAENDTGEVGPGDAVWILTSAFIIFTMISGFGLVESGELNLKASIDLLTVLEAILTGSQPREKLKCLYENLISNNFRKTAVLKKKK